MDMKKILQAMDGTAQQPVVDSNDMKKFLTIVEGKGPLNRPTAAESLTMQHYTEPKKTITTPVLNVAEDAKPSMIGKYFKAVEQELKEAAERPNERAQKLAQRVIERIVPNADGSLPDPSINRLTGKPNPPAADPAPTNVKPSGSTVDYGGATYNLVGVFGDGIRPRIGPGNKAVGAKAYIVGDKMFVLLDPSTQEDIDEACWKGYHKDGMKTMFGKRYPNCIKNKNESLETYINKGECPGCGGSLVAESQLNEKQDACYHKVKSRYKVWPSAYASGALVQCRKKGAANWGNSNESITQEEYDQLDENLKKWFSDKWVRFGPDGKIKGDCARGDDSEGKPKCLPQSKAHSLGKKGRASAAARKRREDPNPERSGKAINVNTKKSNEDVAEATSAAQQAAIAIAKKKAGKK